MKTILVVDDEQEMRDKVSTILEYEGYRTLTASDGRTAIRLAHTYLPDLIICDVLMPGLSGYGVLEAIRRDRRMADVPFIFLTGLTTKQDTRYGMSIGADDFLPKPFEVDDLLAAIRTRLAKHEVESRQIEDLRRQLSRLLPHELRTPLTSILGMTGFLLGMRGNDNVPDFDEILDLQQSIHNSALRLERLIENYLLYARLQLIEAHSDQRFQLRETAPIPTVGLITAVVKQASEKAQRQEDVSIVLVEEDVAIQEEHLWKIVRELLDNALKFSEPGTPIHVTSYSDGYKWNLSIADQGHGMSGEQIASIGAYVQFDRQQYEQQGLGLGLAIVRLLTELYGGHLRIERALEQGTTIHVTVPLRKDQ